MYQKTNYYLLTFFAVANLFFAMRATAQCTATATNTGPYCPDVTVSLLATAGGTAYSWAGPGAFAANTQNASRPMATTAMSGTYTVTITFAGGCTASSVTNVTVNPRPSNPGVVTSGLPCSGATLTLTGSGAGAGGTYSWTGPNGFSAVGASPVLTNVSAAASGAYNLTVTNVFGCSNFANTNVVINLPPTVTISRTGTPCAGNSITLRADAPGGIQFNWVGPNAYTSTLQDAAVNSLTAAMSGQYVVTVTDVNGCTNSGSTTVLVTSIAATANNDSPKCEGTNVQLNATGGLNYAWTGPSGFTANGASATISNTTPAKGGIYTVNISDGNGCTAVANTIVVINANPTLKLTPANIKCFGGSDGSILAQAVTGLAPFSYLWSNSLVGGNADNLPPSTYTVTVTDANGCTLASSATLTAPTMLDISTQGVQNATCYNRNDGKATANIAGGTTPYSYLWSNGSRLQTAIDLGCGSNAVSVTDANGCITFANLTIDCPQQLVATDSSSSPVNCFGGNDGKVSITMQGGTAPYRYDWTTLGNVNQPQVVGVLPGTYPVSVTDANGCTFGPATVTVREPTAALLLTITPSAARCKNEASGGAVASTVGGTANYNYTWSGLASGQTSGNVTNIPTGTYTATVTDARGCITSSTVVITEPDSVKILAKAISTVCYNDDNGFIVVDTAYGGNGGTYTYSLDGSNFQADTTFAGLPASVYTVYAQDNKGCLATVTRTVTQPDPIQLTIIDAPKVSIRMGESYQIQTNVNVSPADLIYIWTPQKNFVCANGTACQSPTVNPLDPTRYAVVVTDRNGCTAGASVLINVEKERNIYVPNVFSPNNDAVNDIWFVNGGLGVKTIKVLKVFDRWGELMYEANNFLPNDPSYGWDGRFKGSVMQPAVFVYFMEVEFIDGQTIPYKGDITIVR